ncbi:hypothetical protein [Chryseobacterium profundimaris]|uniref:RiboL-PSP-HEPN domain-containing protein n=1 Tax=Chryseobacterium profundimaris TaxID=1387275 RepID=A0ABY1NRJ5_9FLAO|nr:hypothetical protein [Chryseobacterium profundimaris]SMP16396.1 hypothetical protein SAMN06264346_10425 [Chryseobacterium profundimaris]
MNTITEHIEKFKYAIHDLYKAYKFTHFSLYHLRDFYHKNKLDENINSFTIEDLAFEIKIEYTEHEIEQAREDGYYQRILAGNTIALIYNLWEDEFRFKISKCLGYSGTGRDKIMNDFFGDLGKIRHSITHNRFNRTSNIDNLVKLHYLFRDNTFILDSITVHEIIEKTLLELEIIKKQDHKQLD